MDTQTLFAILGVAFEILALLYAWRIYFRKDPRFLLIGPKLQMAAGIMGGIGFWLRSVAISHAITRPGLDAVFILLFSSLAILGGISSRATLPKSP